MKRSEEIQQKAREEAWYIADTSQTKEEAAIRGYCLGVAYADRTMLDRACKWLKENIDLYSYNAFNTKSGYCEITLTDEFETAFRQAMEGGAE